MISAKSARDLFLFNDFLQINECLFFISLFRAQHTPYYYKPALTVFLLYMTIIIISGNTFLDWLLPPVKMASPELRCLRVALLRPTVAHRRWDSWRSSVPRWGGSSSKVAIRAVCLSVVNHWMTSWKWKIVLKMTCISLMRRVIISSCMPDSSLSSPRMMPTV